MTKKIFLLVVSLFMATSMFSNSDSRGGVVLTPVPAPPTGNGGHPRTPAATPVFYLDGYTLTASSYTIGSTVELKDEDDTVVFSTYVYMEGDIDLPTDLAGTYTLEVQRGSMTFIGEIEL